MDFARARDIMVESQVRPSDVTDTRIIHAMRTLPRERFAPAQKRTLAYADLELEVAPGPDAVAAARSGQADPGAGAASRTNAALGNRRRHRLWRGGAGGVLHRKLSRSIRTRSFALRRARRWKHLGVTNVKTVSTAAVDGWDDGAPYDVMLLNGAAEFVPERGSRNSRRAAGLA